MFIFVFCTFVFPHALHASACVSVFASLSDCVWVYGCMFVWAVCLCVYVCVSLLVFGLVFCVHDESLNVFLCSPQSAIMCVCVSVC